MNLLEHFRDDPAAFLWPGIIILYTIVLFILTLALQKSRQGVTINELKKIVNCIRDGFVYFVLENRCKIVYISNEFCELLGYDKNEARTKESMLDFVDPGDWEVFQNLSGILVEDRVHVEIRLITREGSVLYVLMNGNCILQKDGKHKIIAAFDDISEQKKMQNKLLLESERYRIATELSKDVIFEYNIQSDEMVFSDKYREIFGRDPLVTKYVKEFHSRSDWIFPDDWGIYLKYCDKLLNGESMFETKFRVKNRLGEFIWCQTMGQTIYDDDKKPLRVIGKLVNIDLNKKELEALEYKATRDPLTNVYNRDASSKKIEKFINGNKENKHMLMFFDFDDFKRVNDNYGHLVGDKVLIHVIRCIQQASTEGEIIGRIGGDEFVIFAGNIANAEEALKKAETIKNTLHNSFVTDKGEIIPISGSVGIAMYPEDGLHYEQLMDRADQALYYVKAQGKNNFMLYSDMEKQ